ncbi:MAG: HAD-IA family hydrolase [Parvularculaceae bacterium]
MSNSPFKAVIFDFGGVFTTSPVENFAVYEKANGLPERFIGGVIKARLQDGAFSRFERGEISVDEFDLAFANETRIAGHEIPGREFVKFLEVDLKPEMVEAFDRVRDAGLKTGCITNNFPTMESDGSPRGARRRDELELIFSKFDCVLESSKLGIRKPEPRIYKMALEALNVAANESVFLDDLGVNLKPARAMGMVTIKVPFGDVTPAIEALSALVGIPLQ